VYGGLGSGSWSLVLWVMGLVKGRVGYIHISLLLNHVLLLCSIGLGNGNDSRMGCNGIGRMEFYHVTSYLFEWGMFTSYISALRRNFRRISNITALIGISLVVNWRIGSGQEGRYSYE